MRLAVGTLVFSAKNKNKLYILGHTSFVSWVSCKNRIEFDKGGVDCTKQANALLPNKLGWSIWRKESVRGDASLTAVCVCWFGRRLCFKIYLNRLESHNSRAISRYGTVYFCALPLLLSCLVSFCMRVLTYPGQLLLYCEIIFWSWSFMQIDQMCSFDQMKGMLLWYSSTVKTKQKSSQLQELFRFSLCRDNKEYFAYGIAFLLVANSCSSSNSRVGHWESSYCSLQSTGLIIFLCQIKQTDNSARVWGLTPIKTNPF